MLKYYFARIQLLMARISVLFREVHPTNQPLADYFARDWASTYHTDTSGVRARPEAVEPAEPSPSEPGQAEPLVAAWEGSRLGLGPSRAGPSRQAAACTLHSVACK